jgi:hypothetical protein
MTATPMTAKHFQIVPVHQDSFGQEVIASNAIAHGSMSTIMENIRDSRARNDSIKADAEKDREITSLRKQLVEVRPKPPRHVPTLRKLAERSVCLSVPN